MKVELNEARDIIIRLTNLKSEAMRAGLVKTFHALDEASKVAGWEMAEAQERQC